MIANHQSELMSKDRKGGKFQKQWLSVALSRFLCGVLLPTTKEVSHPPGLIWTQLSKNSWPLTLRLVKWSSWMKTTVIEWRRLLLNEDDCYWMKTTVKEWRWLMLNEDDWYWMKTTVIEWRRLFLNEDDCYWIKSNVLERLQLLSYWLKTSARE